MTGIRYGEGARCPRCDGVGHIEVDSLAKVGDGYETWFDIIICPVCDGSGIKPSKAPEDGQKGDD